MNSVPPTQPADQGVVQRDHPPRPKVILYGRPGCHLCDDALGVIERVRSRVCFELEQRDIESSDEWFKRYLERIPVVEVDGREAFELFVDEQQLEQMLVGLNGGHSPQ